MKNSIAASVAVCLFLAVCATAGLVTLQTSGFQIAGTPSLVPADAQGYITQGKAYLQAHNLLAARDQFSQAVAADPANQEANFLYGVTRIVAIYENGQGVSTPALDSVREIAELSGFTFTSFGVFDTQTSTEPSGVAATTPDSGAVIDFLAAKAIPEIDGALANFAAVTNPAFSSDLGPTGVQEKLGTTLFADFADVQVIKAAAHLLKCNLELLRVYDLNISPPNVFSGDTSQLMKYRQLLQDKPNLLTPRDASRLDYAKAALISFIDTFNNGVQAMKNRANANSHLFVIDLPMPNGIEFTSSDTADFQKALADVKASLSGPAVYSFVPPSSEAAKVDLSKFFNSAAPINLRQNLVDCAGGVVLPDITIGGMFPLGLTEVQAMLLSSKADVLGTACSGYTAPFANLSPDWAYYSSYNPNQVYQFTIANRGTASLTTNVSVKGQNAADFSLSADTCASLTPTLAPGTSCTVKVAFQPGIPGNRSAVLDVSSNDPSDPHLYAELNGSSAYQPVAGGVNIVKTIVVDPSSPSTFYAGTGSGVLKSTDGGMNWTAVNTGLPAGQVNALYMSSSTLIFAGTNSGLYKSTNAGGGWSPVSNMSNFTINALAATPGGTILAANYGNVYRSSDGGSTWNLTSIPSSLSTMAVDTAHPGVVYAGTWNGLFKSSDSGATWSSVSGTPKDQYNNALSINAILMTPSAIFAGTSQGLYQSSDGSTWSPVYVANVYKPYISVIAVSPAAPGTLFVSDGWNVYRSSDSGASWNSNGGIGNSIYSLAAPDASWLLVGAYDGIYRIPASAGQPRSFALTATATGSGTGTFGVDYWGGALQLPAPQCVNNSCTWNMPEGSSLQLFPQPGAGSLFGGWSGCDQLDGTGCKMTMTADKAVSGAFTLDGRPLSLSAYPPGGTYAASVQVALITNKNVPVRYTTDGTDPTVSSTLYTGPLTFSANTTLKYRGFEASPGPVSTDTYTIVPSARWNWYTVSHRINSDGKQVDVLDAGVLTTAATIDGLTVNVSGPNGFTCNFTNADTKPYLSGTGTLALFKEYDATLAPLTPGTYTFTLTDAGGTKFVRSATLAATRATIPLIDTTAIRWVRKSDGSYRITWAPVNDTQTYYYRVRIERVADGVPVYLGTRKTDVFDDVPAANLIAGTPYQVRIEVTDSGSMDTVFNRSNSAYVPFTPQIADYNSARGIFNYATVFNQWEPDGTQEVALLFNLSGSNGMPTTPAPTLAEVSGPNGFHYQFDLAADLVAGTTNYFKLLPAPQATGQYTFHVVVNGLDHYATATLTAPVAYPVPDQSRLQVQDLGNGNTRFSWAGVNYTGALYYRVMLRNTTTSYTYATAKLNQTFVDIPNGVVSSYQQWRVEVYDSAGTTTQRNRRNGAYVPLSIAPYNAAVPGFGNYGIRNLTDYNGTGNKTQVWMGFAGANPIASLTVTGPNGYNRNLLTQGKPETPPGTSLYYWLAEAGSPTPGLYTFTATDSVGNTAVRYHYQPTAHALPVVDFRTIHVDTELNGDTRISWAPVPGDVLLWYQVMAWGMNDQNGDGKMDVVYQGPLSNSASLIIPKSTMSSLPKPFMFRVRANDGNSNTTMNNISQSVMVGYNVPGYDYSVLADADGDGFASDIDINDTDAAAYPFAPSNAVLTVTPSALSFGNVAVGTTSAPMSFTFTNNGPGYVTLYSADMTGDTSQFPNGYTGGCPDLPHTFAPGDSCISSGWVFQPSTSGAKAVTMTIISNSVNTPVLNVTMTGTGVVPQYSLTTTISGSGSVNNTTQPPAFSCASASCTASFPAGSAFTLSATPSAGYFFSGWSGGGCSGQGNCAFSLNANTTVNATFAPIPLVQIQGKIGSYQSLQSAFNVAAASDILMSRNIVFTESLLLNNPVAIKLKGGFDSSFSAVSGNTVLKGVLTLKSGSLTVENLVIY